MKKVYALVLSLVILVALTACASAVSNVSDASESTLARVETTAQNSPTPTEEVPEEITVTFQGRNIACYPIALTQNDLGTYILILYIEGQSEFAMSQQYSVTAPIYACIVSEEGKPLSPNSILWNKEIGDYCYFFYDVEEMPETLSLVPMDSVDDSTKWQKLILADIPSEVPSDYVLSPNDWNQ